MPELTATLLNKQELAAKIDEASKLPRPEPGNKTTDKARWLQGTVLNCTQFQLKARDSYFDSGRYEVNPSNVNAWSINHFTIVNKDGSLFTGATGATGFNLELQSDIQMNLAYGSTAPWAGAHKTAVVETITTKEGYDNARENGNTIISKDQYQGVDKDENALSIVFEVRCDGGQRPIYVITQKIV